MRNFNLRLAPGYVMRLHALRTKQTNQRTEQTSQPKPPIRPLPVPARPFEAITLHWISGFPKDKHNNDSILHIVDWFSKWAIAIPTNKGMTCLQLCDTLYKEVFSWVGLPESIVGDRVSRLTASAMRALAKHLQVKLKLSTAYHPQTDGESERFHKTMLQMLRAFVNHHHSDVVRIPQYDTYSYRIHTTLHLVWLESP
jgi:transposase InsO family protein